MYKKYVSLRFFAIFSVIILCAVAFHPAIDPMRDYIASLSDEEFEISPSIAFASGADESIVVTMQPEIDVNIAELNAIAQANSDLDTDNDGLYDSVEKVIGTDINNNDSDFDQLDDYYEIINDLDPLYPDSNNDGIADYNEVYNISDDVDNDNVKNAWDIDNDNDGVSDNEDLSPFSKSDTNNLFNIDIKTNGNPSYIDFQIRPKDPDHLTLPLQYWDWPEDDQGLMRDLNNSEKDVFILPYLEMSMQTDFKIISKNSGKCLEVSNSNMSDNATIWQYSYNGEPNQHWSIIPVSEGYVKIIASHSEKCLAVGHAILDNEAPILQETYTGDDNQLWSLEFLGNNSYALIAKHSGKCVEIFNASLEDNATANQFTYSKKSHQTWIIKDIKESMPNQIDVTDYGITIDLNKTQIPLTPIWNYGVVPAFNGKMYFPSSNPLDISMQTKLLWKVYGKSDTALKAFTADNGQMVSANNTAGALVANGSGTGDWETFEWVELGPDRVGLKAHNGKYVGLTTKYFTTIWNIMGDEIVINWPYLSLDANSSEIGDDETFEVVEVGVNKIALKANNGLYVSNNWVTTVGVLEGLSALATVIGPAETFSIVDLGCKSDAIPLVSYYEDFMITGFNFQENYGSNIGCFYNEDINQTIKAGFVMAYEFLRSQHDLQEVPNIIQNRNITMNSSVYSNLAHQDESIFKLMSEMLPQSLYDLTNQSNATILPVIIAIQDAFTTTTLDDITSSILLDGYNILIDVSENPVITSKMFKMNWYNLSNISLLNTEEVLVESMRWGLQFGFDENNETLVTMMGLLNTWNSGEFKITSVGDQEVIFYISESPIVLDIIQYSIFSISSIIDIIHIITKSSKLVTYRFLASSVKYIKQLLIPIANAIKTGLKTLKLSKVAQKALSALKVVVKAIKSSKAAQSMIKFFKSAKVLSFLDKCGTLLVLIDLAITGVIAFYMFWSILFDQGFSDFGAALGAWVVIFSFAYAGVYILLALAVPVIGIILAILDIIFDFFGKLLEWFLSVVTKTEVRSSFNIGFSGDPSLETHDYDNNGIDVGDRIEFLARIYGIVWKTSDGNWGDVCDSYVNPSLTLSVPEGSITGSFKNKISTVSDGHSYRNETYDMGIWVDPISMSNFPLTLQLTYSYKRYYDECVWFFGWWCDRESDSGTVTTDITTLYFDVFPGNLTSFLFWNEITPLDSDGDGLSDQDELLSSSNPWRVDTDGDGLWDKYEVDYGFIPFKSDSDNDGLNDKLETILGTANNNTDTDADGLTDFEEYRGWTVEFDFFGTPFSMHVSPDPLKIDTDDDGLTDLEEFMKGLNPRTNDTDADGTLDPDEIIIPYQGCISNIDFNGYGSSIRVTPNSTVNAEVSLRIHGEECPITLTPSNCSVTVTFENITGRVFHNQTIYQGNPDLHNLTENITSFSFNASENEGIYLVKYFINWSCFGIVPTISNRELIGIIDVNISGEGSKQWECYDLTGGDTDGDGISNLNENIGWIVNYTDSTGNHIIHVTSDYRLIDTDSDGEWDIWEHNCFENSTNPRNPDTDYDGLTDWEEKYRYHTNPLNYDTDGDGLDDQQELIFKSDPFIVDTDDDGLDDKQEFDLKSNPNSQDTDSDGLQDLDEFLFNSSLILPDTDYDTLFDKMEYNLTTNPRDPDTDNDELIDGYELIVNTDPKKADTDNDTINDYYELYWGTNPLDPDTDNDSLIDGRELQYGAHPLIKDTDRDGINDFKDYDTYLPNVDNILLVYDLDEDILEFEQHLELYTNVTVVSLNQLLSDTTYKNSPYIVLVGPLDAGNETVGNLSKNILEDAGENTTEIIASGHQFFASKSSVWNKTQTVVMLSQPHRLDHLVVLNVLKTMWKTVNGSTLEITWPTARDYFNIEAVEEIGTILWAELEKPVIPSIKITKYNSTTTSIDLTKGSGVDPKMNPAGIYLEINASENMQNDTGDIINDAWIVVYYTAADLDKNGDGDLKDIGDINEKSLKFYFFNDKTDKWIKVTKDLDWVFETGVDTNNVELYGKRYEGYIWAHVSHFSLYGLAGLLITPSESKKSTDSFNYHPNADASASQQFGLVDEEITFDASLSTDDGYIESYMWDFGDGTEGSGEKTTYSYTQLGAYDVVLSVTDNSGATDTDRIIVTISTFNNPPNKPIINGNITGTRSVEYQYIASAMDNDSSDMLRYGWDWNNDNIVDAWTDFYPSENQSVINHTFSTAGFYIIKVLAEDTNNARSEWSERLLVFIDIDFQRQNDGTYIIDNERDGSWDAIYNPATDELFAYDIESSNAILILIIAFIVILSIIIFIFYKRK